MSPVVSILIPTYNQNLRLLKECIDSALDQTLRNIEVIVSDNHSTNGTVDFLKMYDDPRLRLVSPKSFLSMNDNFAFCAEHACGKYLSFLSSDDVLLPHALDVLYKHIEAAPDMAFGCGNIHHARRLPANVNDRKSLIRKPQKGKVSNLSFFTKKQAQKFFFPWTMASTWMVGDIIRFDAYKQTGGFSSCNLMTTGDVWLTNSLLEHGGFFCLDEPLALFRARSLISREVDRNRRLFDFTDLLITQPGEVGQTPSTYRRIRQQLSLIYRLGAISEPTSEALERVNNIFMRLHRRDLMRIVGLYQKNKFLLKAPAVVMSWINLTRRLLQVIKNSFKS
jgi:glycosyltransferase involved in cell wall biosynthesis